MRPLLAILALFYWFFREGAGEEIRARFLRAVNRFERAALREAATPRGNDIFLEELGDPAVLEEIFYRWVQTVDLGE